MASFAPNKIDTTAINGGQRYQNGDVVDANAINAPIEASAWAQQTAEEAQVKADFALQKVNESEIGEITLSAYPIGSIYLSVSEVSPASLFGGTWEKIKDRFLLASGDKYANGTMGGEATHTLTVGEMPSHTHKISYYGGTQYQESAAYAENYAITYAKDNFYMDTSRTGGNSPHNNMPPYYAVNAWVRVTEEEFNANESL